MTTTQTDDGQEPESPRSTRGDEANVLATAVRSSSIALFTTDLQSRITICQGRALADLGLETGALVGRPIADLPFPHIAPAIASALQGVCTVRTHTVAGIPFECRCGPILEADTRISGATIVAVDVAHSRDAARQADNAHSRAVIQAFARTLAAQLSATGAPPLRSVRGLPARTSDSIQRIAHLLATVAGVQRPTTALVDLVTLLTGLARELNEANPKSACHVTVESQPCCVRVDTVALAQALVQLVAVIGERAAGSGPLYLVQEVRHLTDDQARPLDLPAGDYAEITVRPSDQPAPLLAESGLLLDTDIDMRLLAVDTTLRQHEGRLLFAGETACRLLLPAFLQHGREPSQPGTA